MHSTPPGWTGPWRKVRNNQGARPPDHRCLPPIPIQARIVWDDTGDELWIDTVAAGWSGRLVYVDATPIRRDYGYRINYVWLAAKDVRRR